jgi:nicotinamidase-related amidase
MLKPKHSAFVSTSLDILLQYLQVKSPIITGIAATIRVRFTAKNAYMCSVSLYLPADCVASNTAKENRHAREQMAKVLKADTRESTELALVGIAQ